MKNIAIIIVTIFFSLTSCEKEFIIKVENADKKIVVNSVFSDAGIIKTEVSKSFSPYGEIKVEELNNAEVKLYKNGTFVENLVYSKEVNEYLGTYKSSEIPEIGKEYMIEVTESELGKVKANSSVPEHSNVSFASVNKIIWGEDNANSYRYNYSFTLEDAQSDDYYYITMALPVLKENEETGEKEFYAFQYAEILTASLPEQQPYIKNGILFKDEAFNGSDFEIYGTATTYMHPFGDYLPPDDWLNETYSLDTTQLYIRLHHLSKDLYDFYSSHSIKLQNEDDIYSEPTPIYSNIENGFGIFGGENVTLMKVDIVY